MANAPGRRSFDRSDAGVGSELGVALEPLSGPEHPCEHARGQEIHTAYLCERRIAYGRERPDLGSHVFRVARSERQPSRESTDSRGAMQLKGIIVRCAKLGQNAEASLGLQASKLSLVFRVELQKEVVQLVLDARSFAQELLSLGRQQAEHGRFVLRMDCGSARPS